MHLALLTLLSCNKHGSDGQEQTPLEPTTGTPPTLCEVDEQVLTPHCIQCHDGVVQPLDLRVAGFAGRVVDQPGDGGTLVVPGNAADSLLVQRMSGALGVMPPAGALSPDLQALVAAWIDGGAVSQCEQSVPFEPEAPHSYARKVKNLLTGLPLTEGELLDVQADHDNLRGLVEAWMDTPGFESKMSEFFGTAFQQAELQTPLEIIGQLRYGDSLNNTRFPPQMHENIAESFARTALRIVQEDRPFTEVADTRQWEMTTAMMVWLLASDVVNPFRNTRIADRPRGGQLSDYYDDDPSLYHTFWHDTPPEGLGSNPTFEEQMAAQAWYVPVPCDILPRVTMDQAEVLGLLAGGLGLVCDPWFDEAVLQPADYRDWRTVDLTRLDDPAEAIPFWDVPELRTRSSIPLAVNRNGFFTTPAFLAKWRSNIDNSFRVVANQALIAALGAGFDSEDSTIPLTSDGLAEEHAAEGTVCYDCHKSLDPMRNFFTNELDPDFSAPTNDPQFVQPSFAFRGHTASGDDLLDLGRAIATHPDFAAAWVQKLCFYANSQPCLQDDPEFLRVAQAFEDSGFSFETLLLELFTSPLVTAHALVQTHEQQATLLSITRRTHLCQALGQRLQTDPFCADIVPNERPTTRGGGRTLALAVPDDEWGRAKETPSQPATPNLFVGVTMEALCLDAAAVFVDRAGAPLRSTDMEASLTFLVEELAGLNPADPRAADFRADLDEHVAAARALVDDETVLLQSAFVLTCTSPFVASIGL
ncbi:MAG: hypothetical protein KTR31_17530 [Myxococcales bacterium]|nr:hypothetical protein [Myxococcales bacterium]